MKNTWPGMTHAGTSPYYPQSNGKLEQFNQSIKVECIRRQNQMNKGPHGGSSGYVGVYPRGDRKAYELHGEFAYLNFPEDYAGGAPR